MNNYKTIFILLFCITFIFIFSITAYPHSGRTDSYGGHNDTINGGYHYHHGYPAHDHPDGKCPYLIKNKDKNTEKEKKYNFIEIIGLIFGSLFLGYLLACIPASVIMLLCSIFYHRDNKEDVIWRTFKWSAITLTVIISAFLFFSFLRK